MAKGGKLTKLMKKLSFGNTTTQTNTTSSSPAASSRSLRSDTSFSSSSDTSANTLHSVYVGKSRRQYLLPSDVVGHPLLQQIAGKSDAGDEATVVVGCEVVLFEHLLWMLENADPMPESLDELAYFYAC